MVAPLVIIFTELSANGLNVIENLQDRSSQMKINADFDECVVLHGAEMEWVELKSL